MKLIFIKQGSQVLAWVVNCLEGQMPKTNHLTIERSKEIMRKAKQQTERIMVENK